MGKKLTSADKDKIIKRIAAGEHMAYIAKDIGWDKGNLCRSLQAYKPEDYRQAVISKMLTLERQATHNLMQASSNEARAIELRAIKSYRKALSRYAPDQFVYTPIPRQDAQAKPPFDKSRS